MQEGGDMPKTLKRILKQDRERFIVPKKVQDIIPVRTVYPDGIFLVGKNKYSKMFRFEDINYAVASIEDKKSMLMEYSDFLTAWIRTERIRTRSCWMQPPEAAPSCRKSTLRSLSPEIPWRMPEHTLRGPEPDS